MQCKIYNRGRLFIVVLAWFGLAPAKVMSDKSKAISVSLNSSATSAASQSSENATTTKVNLNYEELVKRFSKYISHDPEELYNTKTLILTAAELKQLLIDIKQLLKTQPMLTEVDPPVKIVGDIHGQFVDLLRLFDHSHWPPQSRYLFLGDYVDRGPQGLETFCLLAALKLRYPKDVWLLRGNHESDAVNRVYGFYDEVLEKYPARHDIWQLFVETFNFLPVAGLVGKKIFGMHGGISPDLTNFDQIRTLSRPRDIPNYGLMCDLLWSDPEHGIHGWAENTRGISYTFGEDVVRKFCKDMDIALIIRGHQLPDITRHRGYKFFAGTRLLTLFSAPHYCRSAYNDAAVLSVDKDFGCQFEILRPDPRIEVTYESIS